MTHFFIMAYVFDGNSLPTEIWYEIGHHASPDAARNATAISRALRQFWTTRILCSNQWQQLFPRPKIWKQNKIYIACTYIVP